jgi:hypothetical protein
MHGPKTQPFQLLFLSLLVAVGVANSARGAVATNWTAYNDHNSPPGPAPGTHANATTYSMRQTGDGGLLKDFSTGNPLPVRLIVRHEGTVPDDFGANGYPAMGTPAYNIFNGICDVGFNGIVPVRNRVAGVASAVVFTFTNLNSTQKYIVHGTSSRGNNYARRWTIATIQGAVSYQPMRVMVSTRMVPAPSR